MARAYGSSAHLLMKRETAYGQAGTGNYIRIPFNRCNLGSEQGLIDDPVLGQGRDPLATGTTMSPTWNWQRSRRHSGCLCSSSRASLRRTPRWKIFTGPPCPS